MTVAWDRFQRVAGVPDLDALGPDLCVSFPVRHLPGADIAWLNDRWWIERGWNVATAAPRATVTRWLLRHFAVLACEAGSTTLVADRYGGSFGTRHGGSGRCGLAGAFNAKGIGRTPLCPADVQGPHGDGRLSMAEALREAVAAEIAADELPWGAVPVVAIIATGGDPATGEAILIRPNFVRPAHFERSIFFGTAGFPGSDQNRDALRTRAAIVAAAERPEAIGFPGLDRMMERLGQQLGAARAHRLWQGKFLSSNAGVDGALLDFGSFRSVPSWRQFFGEPEEAFGGEIPYIDRAARSLAAGFAKYAQSAALTPAELAAAARRGLASGFDDATAVALGLTPDTASVVTSILRGYFARQQRERVQVGDRPNWTLPWLHDLLIRPERSDERAYAAEAAVLAALRPIMDAPSSTLGSALLRWTCPRPSFHYERTALTLARVGAAIRRNPARAGALAGGAVDALLSRVQRHWPGLPAGTVVHGQVRRAATTVLHATIEGRPAVLLRGPGVPGAQLLFGNAPVPNSGAPWVRADTDAAGLRSGFSTHLGGVAVAVPAPRFTYPPLHRGTS